MLSDWTVAAVIYTLSFGAAVYLVLATGVFTPSEYAYLRLHGITTTATIASCSGSGIHVSCDASFEADGKAHTQTLRDFETSLPGGAKVEVVFDPKDPSQVYATANVAANKDAGSPLLLGLAVLIAVEGLWVVHTVTHQPWLWPLRRRQPRDKPPRAWPFK